MLAPAVRAQVTTPLQFHRLVAVGLEQFRGPGTGGHGLFQLVLLTRIHIVLDHAVQVAVRFLAGKP